MVFTWFSLFSAIRLFYYHAEQTMQNHSNIRTHKHICRSCRTKIFIFFTRHCPYLSVAFFLVIGFIRMRTIAIDMLFPRRLFKLAMPSEQLIKVWIQLWITIQNGLLVGNALMLFLLLVMVCILSFRLVKCVRAVCKCVVVISLGGDSMEHILSRGFLRYFIPFYIQSSKNNCHLVLNHFEWCTKKWFHVDVCTRPFTFVEIAFFPVMKWCSDCWSG